MSAITKAIDEIVSCYPEFFVRPKNASRRSRYNVNIYFYNKNKTITSLSFGNLNLALAPVVEALLNSFNKKFSEDIFNEESQEAIEANNIAQSLENLLDLIKSENKL